MATINLAPATQYAQLARRRRRWVLLITMILAAVLALAWALLFVWRVQAEQTLKETEGRLKGVETEISRLEGVAKRIVLFEQRLAALNTLLNRRVSTNRLLLELERILPPPSVLTNMTVKMEEGIVKITGTAPTVDDVAQALASISSRTTHPTLFMSATLTSISRQEQKTGEQPSAAFYLFSADVKFDINQVRLASRP